MRALAISISVLTLFGAGSASAQRTPAGHIVRRPRPRPLPPPALMVQQGGKSVPLSVTKVNVQVQILGHLAETEMTLTFHNPNARALEGNLYFPLPQGSTVSGYALDVRGMMVDGVVVDKDQGREVFETEVRRKIDPGLVEWTKGRNFNTRVFPIPARGSRTIRVSYVADVRQSRTGNVYQLPLAFRQKIKQFDMRVEVVKAAAPPLVISGGPKGLRFGKTRDSYVAEAKLTNVKLDRDLQVSLPRLEQRPVRVERSPDGKVYFSLRDVVPDSAVKATNRSAVPRRIALYWDASLSRAAASHQRELEVLQQYLAGLGNANVDVRLATFSDSLDRARAFRLPAQRDQLMRAIKSAVYDGGTQMGSLRRIANFRADVALVFSDGLSTFGKEDPPSLGAPTYTVNSAVGANHAFLKYLALRSGGAYINLNRITTEQAMAALGKTAFSFISATVEGAQGLYPKVRTPVHGVFTMAGRLTGGRATVTIKYGLGNNVTHQRSFVIQRQDAVNGDLLRRAWAQKKLDDLLIFPDRNEQEINALGRQYGIVTPGTSLLVLESLDQYLRHGIQPPASLTEMRKKYLSAVKTRARKKSREQSSKLAKLIKLWNKRKAWWNKRFRYPKNYRYGLRSAKKGGRLGVARGYGGLGLRGSGRGGGGVARRVAAARSARMRERSIVRRAPVAAKPVAPAQRGPKISISAWDPKTPYLARLKQTPRHRQYQRYLKLRKKYGKAPAFYLDCGNFFFRQKDRRTALRVLSNLAELELGSPALLRVLAHRLAQLNEFDLSVTTFEQVRKLRPEEPQSFRDLALVLERRADRVASRRGRSGKGSPKQDYARALKLLAKVVMGKWSRFSEIEVIALMELNSILTKAKRFGVRGNVVDRRLIKRMPVDVRIVMTWDADATDMDLHVVEPSGEEAYYSHNRTKIGGMVTRDFTQGYGPEVYLIRRAMRGKYTVKTKFYGSSASKLIGAVTLQVDVYTNYGRPNQKRKSMTLRLKKKKETFTVGSIRF